MTLDDYVKKYGQHKTAQELGITQGAISRALAQKRHVVLKNENGKLEAIEIRKFPFKPKSKLCNSKRKVSER